MSNNRVEIEIATSVEGTADVDKLSRTLGGINPAGAAAEAGARQAASGFDAIGTAALKINNIKQLIGDMVGALGGVPAEVLKTADAYNNLAARVQLVTGTGPAFEAAFTGISEVAQRTSSNLESTGLLFTKLAEAGKSMGFGQAEALKLTETVNQAIQLSGASAQASDAAIVQLVQGLQGGVLRGDEFNSVMEQSPRLAKALADGLGTTTGELRKMAEAGQLSSDVVIKALKGQADTVASEFGKLPPTVGRALENLSTSWTLYVGETDKATGASKAAATVISALAGNLSTIAGYLIDAGQAAAAFTALKLAQSFTGIATAATASATAVAANTVAMTAAGTASTAAAANVGKFASVLSSLKTFSLIGIVTNFHDIGTAIGEAAAKLMGYKDRTEELARAEKLAAQIAADNTEQRTRMAAATQAAIDKQFELGKSATTAIAEFDKLTKAGDTSAEAVAKIGKDFNLATVPGIRDATAVLDKLAADGKISADTFQKAWSDALKGADLAVFETQARAAFAGTSREAERLTQILDASLREAIKRTGLDFEVISGGMGKASMSAINDTEAMIKGLDRLKAMGVDTAAALTASIGKGIDTAVTQKALDEVRQQIEAVRKVLGDKVADGLLDQAKQKADALKEALDKAKPGINSVAEAMKELGVTSDKTFQDTATKSAAAYQAMKDSGTASTRELSEGFKKYATDAMAASGEVGSAQRAVTEATLKTEGAVRGLSVSFDATGKMVVRTQAEAASAINKTTDALRQQPRALDDVTSALERQNAQLERANAAKEKSIGLENKRLNIDKEGYSLNTNGDRVNMAVNTERTLYDNAKGQGLSDAQALQIVNQFMQNGRQVGGDQNANNGGTWSSTVQDAIDKVVLQNARAEPSKKDNTVTETPSESDQSTIIKMMRDAGLAYSSGITMEEATAKVAMVNANKEASQKAKSAYGAATPVATQSSAPTTQKSEQDILRNYMEAAGLTYTPGISRSDAETAVQSKQRADEASKAGVKNATPAPTASAKTYTVNINLGGTNTAINTSSDADAQALISLLQRAKLSA